jgi:hypothetical protein
MEELREWFVLAIFGFGGAVWKFFRMRNLERDRKERLVLMLSGRHKWRSVSVLPANIAASRDETKTLLVQVRARQKQDPPYYWGLISRVGAP